VGQQKFGKQRFDSDDFEWESEIEIEQQKFSLKDKRRSNKERANKWNEPDEDDD